MEQLHSINVVHRDIKPQNIFVSASGHVCLGDFGLAAHPYISSRDSLADIVMTDLAGTPYRMAPELFADHPAYDYNVDIWMYGLVILDLFIGRRDGKSFFQINGPGSRESDMGMCAILTKDIEAGLERYVDGLEAKSLLRMLLSRHPADRPTISEIKNDPFFAPIDWELCAARGYNMLHRPSRPVPNKECNIPRKPCRETQNFVFGCQMSWNCPSFLLADTPLWSVDRTST
ncbi:kinase-like protein [Auriscalpium vulgare]|uniref:Kinase-like protein n=1 Tax=Auriscalpium vulgare TaxID=40419 RepID=A0ACB8RIV1_9AGAM|nr:kinase-like protein [Auriscalpium vulgare]